MPNKRSQKPAVAPMSGPKAEGKFNHIQAGVFFFINRLGGGGSLCPPSVSPLFVVQLPPNMAL